MRDVGHTLLVPYPMLKVWGDGGGRRPPTYFLRGTAPHLFVEDNVEDRGRPPTCFWSVPPLFLSVLSQSGGRGGADVVEIKMKKIRKNMVKETVFGYVKLESGKKGQENEKLECV